MATLAALAKSSRDDVPKLEGTNYEEWRSLALPHLSILGLVDKVTMLPYGLGGGTQQHRELSERGKEMVFLVEFGIRPDITNAATAEAAWRDLEMKYNKISQAQQLDLTYVVLIRPMEDGEGVMIFMHRVKLARTWMIKAGIPMQEHIVCLSILQRLPKKFEFAHGTLVNGPNGMNLKLNDVESQLVMEDYQGISGPALIAHRLEPRQ